MKVRLKNNEGETLKTMKVEGVFCDVAADYCILKTAP